MQDILKLLKSMTITVKISFNEDDKNNEHHCNHEEEHHYHHEEDRGQEGDYIDYYSNNGGYEEKSMVSLLDSELESKRDSNDNVDLDKEPKDMTMQDYTWMYCLTDEQKKKYLDDELDEYNNERSLRFK
jgi:hypothetical protein